jgi:hypothetical protein
MFLRATMLTVMHLLIHPLITKAIDKVHKPAAKAREYYRRNNIQVQTTNTCTCEQEDNLTVDMAYCRRADRQQCS